MNCLEFRRQLFTEPHYQDEKFLIHKHQCADCAAFAQSMKHFDQKLETAIRVEVPENLASRIRLDRVIRDEQRRRNQRPWYYAMAASIMLIVAVSSLIGYRLYLATEATKALQQAVIQHIHLELNHLHEQRNVQVAQSNRLLAPFGAHLKEDFGAANYAGTCPIGRQLGAHLVVPGQKGPVTIIYVPDEGIVKRLEAVHQRFSSILLPAGKGGLAIVGEHDEALDEMARKVENHMIWNL